MQRNIIIYSILLISLIGISLFLTSNFIDSEKNELTDPVVKNIFQADEVSLKVSFSDRTIDFSIKSQMLNSLADSDFMRLFNPEISFDNKKNLKILGISKTADFFYKSNVFKFNELVNFEGTFDNTKFNGVIGKLELNLNDNTAEVSENLKLSFDGQIYSADSILVDLSERKILRSTNVRYETVND